MRSIKRSDLLLYAVTDRTWLNGGSLIDVVHAALDGGVTCLQLREKGKWTNERLHDAEILNELCQRYDVPFIVNDNIAVALGCGATGVHVGQGDTSLEVARAMLGVRRIIGVSAQTEEQALLAEDGGADYIGVGAIFPTGTKKDAVNVKIETLANITLRVKIPVVAIGGISEQNLDLLADAGIAGIAVVSAIFAVENIGKATRQLRAKAENLFA